MHRRRIQQFAALAVFGVSVPLFGLSCVIRVGPGEAGDVSAFANGETAGPGGGSSDATPEQILAMLDPDQVAIATATADTAGYIAMSSFAGAVADPALVDEAMFEELIATYAPLAFDEASLWISSLDPATLTHGIEPRFDCHQTHGCPFRTECPFAKSCIVTGCGNTRCGPCPEKLDLTKFASNGWCSYTCMVGSDIAGIALIFFSKLLNIQVGPFCLSNTEF